MTIKESGVSGSDMWKWLLGAAVSIVLALGMFAVGQLAQANTARLERLERATDTLAEDRIQDAGDIRELRATYGDIVRRLDRIEGKVDQALGRP